MKKGTVKEKREKGLEEKRVKKVMVMGILVSVKMLTFKHCHLPSYQKKIKDNNEKIKFIFSRK